LNDRDPHAPDLNAETRAIWDANAEWWDDRIGDGNDFQLQLIEPATERLLELKRGEAILDVACGAGRLARRYAELGAHVVACDFSARFIERARRRTPAGADVEYHVIDACDRLQLLSLGSQRFDAAVATMALMDMAAIEPLFAALRELLKPGGRFVFSVCHPCFNSAGGTRFMEARESAGRYSPECGVKVTRYLTPATWKSEGIVGQPEPQYYFHRPLHALLGAAFREGFVLDALEEPALAPQDAGRGIKWEQMPDIPPVLAARLRLAPQGKASR
jgi:SAM-dependent methyltransferase